MKTFKTFIPFIIIICIVFVILMSALGLIDLGEIFGFKSGLQIDYYVDGREGLEEGEADLSLLDTLRQRKSENKEEESTKIVESKVESKESEGLSAWERMQQRNKEKKLAGVEEEKKEKPKLLEEKPEEKAASAFEEMKKKASEKKTQEPEKKEEKKLSKAEEDFQKKTKEYEDKKKARELDEYKRDVKLKEREKEKEEQKEQEKADNIVYLSITCHTAVDNEMHKDPKFRQSVPPSGVILSRMKFKMQPGSTAFDVLKTASQDYKFRISYNGTAPKYYIQSINGLAEFDGGPLSGWMFSVNGSFPTYGVGEYVVKGGDEIEFQYTCNLGKDVGTSWD